MPHELTNTKRKHYIFVLLQHTSAVFFPFLIDNSVVVGYFDSIFDNLAASIFKEKWLNKGLVPICRYDMFI